MVPAAPSEATATLVQLASGPVNVIDQGEGPVLLSIHGVPGSTRDFRWLAAGLEGPLRFIRFDLPGFAETPLRTMPKLSFAARADFVMQLADALGLERFALVGHSMGGGVAMHVAARYPDRITGIALLCSIGLRPHRAFRRFSSAKSLSWALRWVPGVSWLLGPKILKSFIQSGFSPQLTLAECIQSIHLVGVMDYKHMHEAAAACRVPTFLSWAEDDVLIEPAIPLELGAALPDGPRIAFETGGHNIQKNQAIELTEALIAWVNSLATDTAKGAEDAK